MLTTRSQARFHRFQRVLVVLAWLAWLAGVAYPRPGTCTAMSVAAMASGAASAVIDPMSSPRPMHAHMPCCPAGSHGCGGAMTGVALLPTATLAGIVMQPSRIDPAALHERLPRRALSPPLRPPLLA